MPYCQQSADALGFRHSKSRTAPPILFGGLRQVVRCPLCGHQDTASGGKRGGPLPEKHRSGEPAAPLNRVLKSTCRARTPHCGIQRIGRFARGRREFFPSAARRRRRRRDARRCSSARGIGRRHRTRRCQIHRHALGASRRIRRRHHGHCRINAGAGKLGDRGLNRARRRAARDCGGRERQSRAIGRRTSRYSAAYGG
jgi:hypothetical protein